MKCYFYVFELTKIYDIWYTCFFITYTLSILSFERCNKHTIPWQADRICLQHDTSNSYPPKNTPGWPAPQNETKRSSGSNSYRHWHHARRETAPQSALGLTGGRFPRCEKVVFRKDQTVKQIPSHWIHMIDIKRVIPENVVGRMKCLGKDTSMFWCLWWISRDILAL